MRLSRNSRLRINFRAYERGDNRRLVCNFRCPYCLPLRDNVRQTKFSEADFQRAKALWDKLATVEDELLVKVNFDGETMCDPWAKEICFYINGLENVRVMEIVTNNWFPPETYAGRLDPEKVCFSLSYHPYNISRELFLDNARELLDKGFPLFATMVVVPENVNRLASVRDDFMRHGILLKPLLLLGNHQQGVPANLRSAHKLFKKIFSRGIYYPDAYSDRERRILRQQYYSDLEFDYQSRKTVTGQLCYAGTDMINLYMNGAVRRCFIDPLGTVDDLIAGTSALSRKPRPCHARACPCPTHMIFLQEFYDRYTLCGRFVDHYHVNPENKLTTSTDCDWCRKG